MKSLWTVVLAVSVMLLSNTGAGFQVFAGDVIKPTLKGQDDKYRKAGDPQPLEEEKPGQEVVEERGESQGVRGDEPAPPRRGPHDDLQDRYGRRLSPEDELENRYGRRGGRYDGQDGRYDRPDGRYDREGQRGRNDGRDEGLERVDRQPRELWQQNDQLYGYGRFEKAPTPQAQAQQRRLESHYRNHYRHSQYYRQAYDSSHSGRFRHYNESRFQSDDTSGGRGAQSPRYLPNLYR